MNSKLTFMICLIWFIQKQTSKEVLKLTTKNFKTTKNSSEYLLVLFHETECPYCKEVISHLTELNTETAEKYPSLKFATLNVEENETIEEEEDIQKSPELRLYLNGDVFAFYVDSINKQKVTEFIEDILDEQKTAKIIKTEKDYQNFKNTDFAIYFGLPEITELNIIYVNNIARIFPDVPVFWAETHGKFDGRIIADEDEKFFYHFKFKRNFDDGDKSFNAREGLRTSAIIRAIRQFQVPTIQTLTPTLLRNIINEGIDAVVLFDRTLSGPLINKFEIAALKANYSAIFIKTTIDDSNAQILAKVLGVEEADFPVLRCIRTVAGKQQKYKFEGDFSQKNINNFIYDFGKKQLEEYFKSGKYVNNFDKEFHKYNRKQFAKVLDKGSKDVFVGFIGKWCPDCGGVQTVLVDLNKKITVNRDTIILASIDTDENDIDSVLSQQLPAIQLYKRLHSKKPILYKDKFTAENIIKFLEKELGRKFAREDDAEDEEQFDEEVETLDYLQTEEEQQSEIDL